MATDADGETPTYSITGGDSQFVFNIFSIDAQTGELSFRLGADFDEDLFDDNIFIVEVTADDRSSNLTTQTITVNVLDGDPAPTLFSVPNTVTLNENDTFSDLIGAQDNFDDQTVTFTLGGPDAAFFSIMNSSPGSVVNEDLELISPLDFENPLDADGDNVYVVDIIASDGVNTTTETVTLTIIDVFESANAPVFTTPDTVTVNQGDTFVQTVVATDADGETPTYFISGGEDQFSFEIDSATGDLSFRFGGVDFDETLFDDNIFTVEVTADDGSGNETIQSITINVEDANVAPIISVSINSNILENDQFSLFMLGASDFFDMDFVSLTLGGEDAGLVDFMSFDGLQSAFGEIQLPSFDFENPEDADGNNIYVFEVTASDGVNTVTETFSITVTDVFESPNAPVFTTPESVVIDERQSFVANLDADDADGDTVIFSITGGEDRFAFFIDPNTNDLNFINPPQFNDPDGFFDNLYTVEITADDQTGNEVTQIITIEVQDVDLAPEISVFAGSSFTIDENSSFSQNFIVDGFNEGQLITLSLGGDDAEFFTLTNQFEGIDFSNAFLELANSLDFENPQDTDGDNIYTVDIIASDGVNTTIETINVTVEDDSSEVGTIKSAPAEQAIDVDLVLASFEVLDNDEALDLNTLSETGTTLEDVYSGEFRASTTPDVSFEVDAEQIGFELESSAVEMQFAADLLLLQDSSAVIDG